MMKYMVFCVMDKVLILLLCSVLLRIVLLVLLLRRLLFYLIRFRLLSSTKLPLFLIVSLIMVIGQMFILNIIKFLLFVLIVFLLLVTLKMFTKKLFLLVVNVFNFLSYAFSNCQFIEGLDLSAVVPFMDIDLEQALLSGIVPGDGVIPEYNGIEETDSVIGRVRDNFDAIEHQRNLNHAMQIYKDSLAAKSSEQSTSLEAE